MSDFVINNNGNIENNQPDKIKVKDIQQKDTNTESAEITLVKGASTDDTKLDLQIADSSQANESEKDENSQISNAVKRRNRKLAPRPLYYIGGCNGAAIVDDYLSNLGWERIMDKTREDYRLKWCEVKAHNNYYSFKEGEQLCYQIPNNKVLTTKIGLLSSLREYERVMHKVKKGKPRIMRYQEFFPQSYRLDIKEERDEFFENYQEKEYWISKPTGLNQGKGIYLIRSKEDIAKIQEKMSENDEDIQSARKLPFKAPMARIVQKYVCNPLLLDGKKFDVRNYMLIASAIPFVVFYCDGYCRLTCMPYDHNSTDLTGHLTNQFMQKKNPLYGEMKDETVWSMDRFNDYVNKKFKQKKSLAEDWVHTVLRKRCQQIMLHCFQAVRHKLECRLGFFDLYGFDFLVDDDFKIHLLEINCNPALHTNCETLKEVIPAIVNESLDLVFDIHAKTKQKERIMPIAAQRNFVTLYNGDLIEAEERREKLKATAEARKRAQSAQRKKKFIINQAVRYAALREENDTSNNANTSETSVTMNSKSNTNTSTTVRSLDQMPSSSLYQPPPPRVVQSKSMPNVSTKKPFYAGSVSSRPYSAPKFQRKPIEIRPKNNAVSNNQLNQSKTEEVVTADTVSASLNAKLPNYKRAIPATTNQKSNDKIKSEKKESIPTVKLTTLESRTFKSTNEQTKQKSPPTKGMFTGVEQLSKNSNLKSVKPHNSNSPENNPKDTESPKNDDTDDEQRRIRVKKVLEAVSASAAQMRSPSAKLPQNYHNDSPTISGSSSPAYISDFSKRYLANVVNPKNKNQKTAANMKVFNTPLPSAMTYPLREPLVNPSEVQNTNKVPYRSPTTVCVRQTLQATTCTLEIGPKMRRGLVAVNSSSPPNQQLKKQQIKTTQAKLRLINAPTVETTSPLLEEKNISRILPPVHTSADNSPSPMDASNSRTSHTNYDDLHGPSVDSSTQTPNSVLTSEEKVIWRLRSRIGAANVRVPNHLLPGTDHLKVSASSNSHPQPSKYMAVRPTNKNGVILAISPPSVVAGKTIAPESNRNSIGTMVDVDDLGINSSPLDYSPRSYAIDDEYKNDKFYLHQNTNDKVLLKFGAHANDDEKSLAAG